MFHVACTPNVCGTLLRLLLKVIRRSEGTVSSGFEAVEHITFEEVSREASQFRNKQKDETELGYNTTGRHPRLQRS